MAEPDGGTIGAELQGSARGTERLGCGGTEVVVAQGSAIAPLVMASYDGGGSASPLLLAAQGSASPGRAGVSRCVETTSLMSTQTLHKGSPTYQCCQSQAADHLR